MTGDIFKRILVADDGLPEGGRTASLGLRPSEDPSIRRRKMEERFGEHLILGRYLDVEMTLEIVEGWASKQIRKRANYDNVDLVIVGQSNPPQNS